jgi:hypothetical protein
MFHMLIHLIKKVLKWVPNGRSINVNIYISDLGDVASCSLVDFLW